MICISLGDTLFKDTIAMISKIDMVEIRADLLQWSPGEYIEIINKAPCSLFTYRPGNIKEAERINYYRKAVEAGADYIDVEMEASDEFLSEIRKMLYGSTVQLVISYHNYKITPPVEELKRITRNLYNSGADIAKIACMVNHTVDASVLLSLFQEPGRKVVVGMGDLGKIVRLASVLLGGEFTFASIDTGRVTAPGQMTLKEMNTILEILKPGS